MQRVKATTLGAFLNKFGAGKHGWRQGNPALNQVGTRHDADWMDSLQEEICSVIEAMGIAIDPTKRDQLLTALKLLIPYDVEWIAGFEGNGTAADLVAQRIGTSLVTRPTRYFGFKALLTTAPTGSTVIVDVRKNGATVFSALPSFAIGATVLTPGTFTGGSGYFDAAVDDVIDIHVTQVGSAIKGKGLRAALMGRLL